MVARRYTDTDNGGLWMSELPWAPELAEAPQNDQQDENAGRDPGTLAMSLDDFSSLEERILRAVNLVKRERMARSAAEERATEAETKLHHQNAAAEELQKEINALRAERDHIRQRVEKLLSQLDALEL
jgi:FtsZ-binding cell division protein ZapB